LKEKRPGYRLDMIALFKLFVGRKIRALWSVGYGKNLGKVIKPDNSEN
jgi:hypothetical protein